MSRSSPSNGRPKHLRRKLLLPTSCFSCAKIGVLKHDRSTRGECLRPIQTNPCLDLRSALVARVPHGKHTASLRRKRSFENDALKRSPNDLEALLQRSQVYFRKRKFADALADLNLALTISPTSAQAHFFDSRVFWSEEDQMKRREDLVATLRMVPDSMPARFDLADALLKANKPKEALETLDRATVDQKRALWHLPLPTTGPWSGEEPEAAAEEKRRQSLNGFRAYPQLMLQDGVLKFAARDFPGAQSSLERVLQETPDDVRALSLCAGYLCGPESAIRRHGKDRRNGPETA